MSYHTTDCKINRLEDPYCNCGAGRLPDATGTARESGELIYLATPYSDPDPAVMEQRFVEAARVAGMLMSQGKFVFCPITHTHPIAVQCDLPRGWDFWCQYDHIMLGAAHRILVVKMLGWENSKGIAAEIEIARKLGKPIEYMDAPAPSPAHTASRTAELREQVMKWENREAAVCPEDYSFEEVIAERNKRVNELIGTLIGTTARMEAAERENERLKEAWAKVKVALSKIGFRHTNEYCEAYDAMETALAQSKGE